jgi:hypothetical protein
MRCIATLIAAHARAIRPGPAQACITMQKGNAPHRKSSRPNILLVSRAQCSLCNAGDSAGTEAAVEFFRAEKIAVVEDNSSKTCRSCGEKLKECRCGERTWDD